MALKKGFELALRIIFSHTLLLETVAITRLDQTPFDALDENNAFNAVGMRQLSEVISTNKKERAAIESEAEVSVAQTHLDATKRKLSISQ